MYAIYKSVKIKIIINGNGMCKCKPVYFNEFNYDLLSFNPKERILILYLSSPLFPKLLTEVCETETRKYMFWSWLVKTTWINVTAHKIEQFLGGLYFSLPKWIFLQEVPWRFILISRLWLWSLCSVISQVT